MQHIKIKIQVLHVFTSSFKHIWQHLVCYVPLCKFRSFIQSSHWIVLNFLSLAGGVCNELSQLILP